MESAPGGALWGPPGCGYVVVPALHIPTSQEAAAAGMCGFNLPVKTSWWPCSSYSASKRKIGKGKRRFEPRVGLVLSMTDNREMGPSELTGPVASSNSDRCVFGCVFGRCWVYHTLLGSRP